MAHRLAGWSGEAGDVRDDGLRQLGLGNSTIVGIGGDEEEKAARFIEAEMTTPVVSYIAGFTAPPGKTMGHAGAIISGTSGTAQGKKDALEACGIRVGTTPAETAQLVAEAATRR